MNGHKNPNDSHNYHVKTNSHNRHDEKELY